MLLNSTMDSPLAFRRAPRASIGHSHTRAPRCSLRTPTKMPAPSAARTADRQWWKIIQMTSATEREDGNNIWQVSRRFGGTLFRMFAETFGARTQRTSKLAAEEAEEAGKNVEKFHFDDFLMHCDHVEVQLSLCLSRVREYVARSPMEAKRAQLHSHYKFIFINSFAIRAAAAARANQAKNFSAAHKRQSIRFRSRFESQAKFALRLRVRNNLSGFICRAAESASRISLAIDKLA